MLQKLNDIAGYNIKIIINGTLIPKNIKKYMIRIKKIYIQVKILE